MSPDVSIVIQPGFHALCCVVLCCTAAFREQSELSHQVLHHAVESLYEAIFRQCTYEAWQQKSHVQNLTTATNKQQQQQKSTSSVLSPQDKLVRLALFLCLWTEAANLRHTPELLWLVFHMMVISKVYVEVSVWCVLVCVESVLHSQPCTVWLHTSTHTLVNPMTA